MWRWQTFSLFALSELVCTKKVPYPIHYSLLIYPKLILLWSVPDRRTDWQTRFFTPCSLILFFFHWARGGGTSVALLAPNYFHVASGTRRVCRKSTRVLGWVMRQNFCSGNNTTSPIKKNVHIWNHSIFSHMETMGAVHHALSRRPLSSGAHSDTIDLFPTEITTSGTLVFFMISSGGPGKTKFLSTHIFKGRIKQIHDNQMGFSAAPRHPAPIPMR